MHTLLLAENIHQAQFIQRGLQYENLSSDLLPINVINVALENAIFHNDGIFLLITNFHYLENVIDYCLERKKNIPIVVLCQEFDPLLLELRNKKFKIRNYFIRPFPFRLMSSEMRTYIFQEKESLPNKILKMRDLELNRESHEIRVQGQSVYLRNKEFALLEFFMMNTGKVLSRETILENVWDRNANIFTNTVDVHINKLRKKIHHSTAGKYIRTIPCSGYIFE